MPTATVTLKSMGAPYSPSRMLSTARRAGEDAEAHDRRCWRERMLFDGELNPDGTIKKDGPVLVPLMGLTLMLANASRKLNLKIPGRKGASLAKALEAGIYAMSNMPLNVKASQVNFERLSVPADGKPGGGTRVWRHFPCIMAWQGQVEYAILDEAISEEGLRLSLEAAGKLIGLGRFRPEKRGFYGRFEVVDLKWSA
jgi:hypothetical protein